MSGHITPEEDRKLAREMRPSGIIKRNPWPKPLPSYRQQAPTPKQLAQARRDAEAAEAAYEEKRLLRRKKCALCHHEWHLRACGVCKCPK